MTVFALPSVSYFVLDFILTDSGVRDYRQSAVDRHSFNRPVVSDNSLLNVQGACVRFHVAR